MYNKMVALVSKIHRNQEKDILCRQGQLTLLGRTKRVLWPLKSRAIFSNTQQKHLDYMFFLIKMSSSHGGDSVSKFTYWDYIKCLHAALGLQRQCNKLASTKQATGREENVLNRQA